MTMMVPLTGGNNAAIQPPIIVFTNMGRSYTIRGVSENIPGVFYRSSPKILMDLISWAKWLSEPQETSSYSDEIKRVQ